MKKKNNPAEFYIFQRLKLLLKLASENGCAYSNCYVSLKNIEKEVPNELHALIYGDLWHGNCLIDPATCFDHDETFW